YTQTLYHIVLRTKRSEKSIPQQNASSLYKYVWGVIKNKKESSKDELMRIFKECGVDFDEKYLS
ncbi:MAG: hypothetical protein LBN93_01540, partial [Candidatus Symbiothrix sp.]|nr:hypothetical protein [Candidatus Symbiothrix sp.]